MPRPKVHNIYRSFIAGHYEEGVSNKRLMRRLHEAFVTRQNELGPLPSESSVQRETKRLRNLVRNPVMTASLEDMVRTLATNDIPHIQARLSGLEAQSRMTIALVIGLILAVVAGAVSVMVGR